MGNMRVTTRILADVEPKVKEKLKSIADDYEKSMTEVLTILIESEYLRRFENDKEI